jgi:pimeloyl-ACP methyl ester carboxylesterase
MAENSSPEAAGTGRRLPLLLLSGVGCDRALWEHQELHLGRVADIHVPDLTGADTVEELARRVLAEAPPRFALAGLSMGGYVALEIMRRAPGRVERLALLDTNAHADPPEVSQRRRVLMSLVEDGQYEEVVDLMYPSVVHPARLDDSGVRDVFGAMALRVGAAAFLRQQTAIIERPDSMPDLPGIECPTLILCGRQDMLSVVDVHADMAEAIPGAKLTVVEDCGHLSTLERPQAVTALLHQWLVYG